mgnify:CR=1 FL=1
MPNPTRQEIIDAYTAVTTLARLAEEFTPVRVEEHKEINDLHLAVRAASLPNHNPQWPKSNGTIKSTTSQKQNQKAASRS